MRRVKKRSCPCLRRFLAIVATGAIALFLFSLLLVLPYRWLPPPTSSFMLQSLLRPTAGIVHPYHYRWVPYADISPYMGLAAIAAEDQRFPDHHGFDMAELEQVWKDYRQGVGLRGGSTISQQVAKNLYLWSGRSLFRKGLEAWFTVLLEGLWSKQRILEIYLNIAEFGDRIYGVEAASQQFFNHDAAQLSAAEAALLAAVLPGPEIYFVDQPSWEVLQRQDWILQQMDQLGGVSYLDKL